MYNQYSMPSIKDYKLIIVIGLPASGKSTYCSTLKDYIVYDDFMDNFIGSDLMKTLKNNKVCINDPRLCIYKHFDYYIQIFTGVVPKDKIKLVLFKNDPVQCRINNLLRDESLLKTHTRVEHSINELSKRYNIDLYYDLGIDIEILSIYSPGALKYIK